MIFGYQNQQISTDLSPPTGQIYGQYMVSAELTLFECTHIQYSDIYNTDKKYNLMFLSREREKNTDKLRSVFTE